MIQGSNQSELNEVTEKLTHLSLNEIPHETSMFLHEIKTDLAYFKKEVSKFCQKILDTKLEIPSTIPKEKSLVLESIQHRIALLKKINSGTDFTIRLSSVLVYHLHATRKLFCRLDDAELHYQLSGLLFNFAALCSNWLEYFKYDHPCDLLSDITQTFDFIRTQCIQTAAVLAKNIQSESLHSNKVSKPIPLNRNQRRAARSNKKNLQSKILPSKLNIETIIDEENAHINQIVKTIEIIVMEAAGYDRQNGSIYASTILNKYRHLLDNDLFFELFIHSYNNYISYMKNYFSQNSLYHLIDWHPMVNIVAFFTEEIMRDPNFSSQNRSKLINVFSIDLFDNFFSIYKMYDNDLNTLNKFFNRLNDIRNLLNQMIPPESDLIKELFIEDPQHSVEKTVQKVNDPWKIYHSLLYVELQFCTLSCNLNEEYLAITSFSTSLILEDKINKNLPQILALSDVSPKFVYSCMNEIKLQLKELAAATLRLSMRFMESDKQPELEHPSSLRNTTQRIDLPLQAKRIMRQLHESEFSVYATGDYVFNRYLIANKLKSQGILTLDTLRIVSDIIPKQLETFGIWHRKIGDRVILESGLELISTPLCMEEFRRQSNSLTNQLFCDIHGFFIDGPTVPTDSVQDINNIPNFFLNIGSKSRPEDFFYLLQLKVNFGYNLDEKSIELIKKYKALLTECPLGFYFQNLKALFLGGIAEKYFNFLTSTCLFSSLLPPSFTDKKYTYCSYNDSLCFDFIKEKLKELDISQEQRLNTTIYHIISLLMLPTLIEHKNNNECDLKKNAEMLINKFYQHFLKWEDHPIKAPIFERFCNLLIDYYSQFISLKIVPSNQENIFGHHKPILRQYGVSQPETEKPIVSQIATNRKLNSI